MRERRAVMRERERERERERGECSEQLPMVNPRRPHSGVNIHNRTKN